MREFNCGLLLLPQQTIATDASGILSVFVCCHGTNTQRLIDRSIGVATWPARHGYCEPHKSWRMDVLVTSTVCVGFANFSCNTFHATVLPALWGALSHDNTVWLICHSCFRFTLSSSWSSPLLPSLSLSPLSLLSSSHLVLPVFWIWTRSLHQ